MGHRLEPHGLMGISYAGYACFRLTEFNVRAITYVTEYVT